MNFKDMPYSRIEYEELEKRYKELIEELENASDASAAMEVIKKKYALWEDMTPMELSYVRHDMDVNDSFYSEEQAYYDEIGPKLTDLSNQLDKLLYESPYRSDIEKETGHLTFDIMECNLKGFDAAIIPLAQEENNLLAEHSRITSNILVEWNGEQIISTAMGQYLESDDREIRRRASLAVADAWEKHRPELEALYDKLVHNRDKQAKQLGMSNYTELSYYRRYRIGYGVKEVFAFREEVKKHLVPFMEKLEERRRERLGYDKLYFYDGGIYFNEGNPKPLGGTEECLELTRKMYHELSPETAEFIDFLLDNHLYDVEVRQGKRGGGYMTSFEKYRAPFIFANFDGTSENAYVMCHEGGHAFQNYLKRSEDIRDKCSLVSEAAETHSMSMEFFAIPYMELFFGDRAEDYAAMHLESAVNLIASECRQDEFQQLVYENPDMGPEERNALWKKLGEAYFPFANNEGNAYLSGGCSWQKIPHMFQWPFYAIDYALAEVCALQYAEWMNRDFKEAWESYLKFCMQTGVLDFPELVEAAGLSSPFEKDGLCRLIKGLKL